MKLKKCLTLGIRNVFKGCAPCTTGGGSSGGCFFLTWCFILVNFEGLVFAGCPLLTFFSVFTV